MRKTRSQRILFILSFLVRGEPVELALMGRREDFDLMEIRENVPNLLGQAPLEVLDLVVDPKRRRLIPNPEHGGEPRTEKY